MITRRSTDASSIASTGASTDAQATALEWSGNIQGGDYQRSTGSLLALLADLPPTRSLS